MIYPSKDQLICGSDLLGNPLSTMTEQPLPPHSTLSLEYLLRYNNELSLKTNNPIAFSDLPPECSNWANFRNTLWGNGLQALWDPLSDGARPVVQVPETTPADLAMLLCIRKFLVRSEYEEAEQAILLANRDHSDAILISGQPGIGSLPFPSLSVESNFQSGKTIFLIWLLMRRLVLGLPTALQINSDFALLFHEGGTSLFSTLRTLCPYEEFFNTSSPLAKLWVLVDSNNDLAEPSLLFTNRGPFFVVEALSPRVQRFNWTDKVHVQVFYMKTWTSDEVRQVSVTPLFFDSSWR